MLYFNLIEILRKGFDNFIMRGKKNIETIILKEGECLKKEFDNYIDMAENAVDWTLFCTYQFKPTFSEGIYKVLQLPSMQIIDNSMSGGIMFDFVTPKDSITFSLMKNISHRACVDHIKLQTDMISITDDTKVYNFMSSSDVKIINVSLRKNADSRLLKKLRKGVDKYYVDNDKAMADLLTDIVERYADAGSIDSATSMQIELQVTEAMLKLLDTQEAQEPHFTKSEKITLTIKRDLLKHMDHKKTLESLASEYKISIKSLQNAFKSLFGFKPTQFMRLLKLNLVHHELMQSNASDTSVQRVAQKWGFAHMGHFSKYYKELYGETPAVTLRASMPTIDGMKEHCVKRQEEIL